MSRDTVGSEATGPNSPGWARIAAMSERQSPPKAMAVARSRTILAGSVDRERLAPGRQGVTHGLQQAGMFGGLAQEFSTGMSDQRLTADAQMGPGVGRSTLHYGVPLWSGIVCLRQAK